MNKTKNTPTRLKQFWSPVPNNPRDNELYVDKGERSGMKKWNKNNMIFGANEGSTKNEGRYGFRQTASGRWRDHDEPDDATQLKQADAINKTMQKRTAATGRERLKNKGAVPVRVGSGKKLFEDFCREALKSNKQIVDNKDMRNLYNAANSLSYEQWLWFVNDEYSSRI